MQQNKVVNLRKANPTHQCSNGEDCLSTNVGRMAFWMRVIGIPLDASNIQPKCLKYWSIGFGWSSFIVSVTINLMALVIQEKPQTTAQWNDLLTSINFSFGMVAVQVGLLVMLAPKWNRLVPFFKRLDELRFFRHEDCVKCRKICCFGIAFLVFMVGISRRCRVKKNDF